MFPVSLVYKEKIQELNRTFDINIKIYHSNGLLTLTDKDLVEGSFLYSEGTQASEEFTIGGTVASDIEFTILRKPEYDLINFTGARVQVNIGLEVVEPIDAHFMQPSQPSSMIGYDGEYEFVPLGVFYIDEVNKMRNTIQLKAIDNMIKLDDDYITSLSYPATLYQVYANLCNLKGISVGTVNFPNQTYMVNKPQGDLSIRDVLGYVAELSGTFAKCNRYGALELKWYQATDTIIKPINRFDLKLKDDLVQITGIMVEAETEVYLTGTDDYVINLSENPLLNGNYETLLPNILSNVGGTIFTPYECEWQGNPSLQSEDKLQQLDVDGITHNTIITSMTYKYRGKSTMKGSGLSKLSRGFKGSTDKRINEIKKQVTEELEVKLSGLEQAQLESTELLANMLGGYIIKDEVNGIIYIADNPNIDLAMKVWKYGINGFGYSSTGVNGIYTTAVTADGSIVAMLISANIITANMIQTGILQANNGISWFDLDNGEINIKNQLRFVNGQLILNSAEAIKTLPDGTQIKGGTTTIDNTKVRVNHGSSGEYSEMNYQGVKRQWLYGESEYLTDIWIYQGIYSGWQPTSPQMIRIDLPARFRGRVGKLKFLIIPTQLNYDGLGRYQEYLRTISTIMKVENIVINNSEAYVWISAFIMTDHGLDAGGNRAYYQGLNFDLMVVGN